MRLIGSYKFPKPFAALLGFGMMVLGICLPSPAKAANALLDEDYNQWKRALGTNAATSAQHLSPLPGFKVELLRSAQTNEGSWVAMAFDPKGRVVIAREDKGLLRFILPTSGPIRIPPEIINTNLLECRGLLFAYDSLYANANNSKGLYRLRDTNGDDQFDEIKLLRATPGGVGHGRNQLALGPDGMIYSIHGDDVRLPVDGVSLNSPLQHYAEDRLLPCEWDKHLFNADAKMPFGHLIRTDPDGSEWKLMAGGLRNPYGIDFNETGDLFTFDADMEWDVGLSWYHPTRVLHLVPGGDYGWRRGTGVLPAWSPDTLPSVVDMGVSSPTAIKFGTKSHFPDPFRKALFILDWSYGKIFAVHLQPVGASYRGRAQIFLQGRPLNVTGLEFGPDGAMYFVTGGRRTQSGLYRVSWIGGLKKENAQSPSNKTLISIKKKNRERLKENDPETSLSKALWSRLNDNDLWVRHAARVVLESQPADTWREQAFKEKRPAGALTALLALSRAGDRSLQPDILRRLQEISRGSLTAEQQLIAIRGFSVCFLRMGKPDAVTAKKIAALWEPRYPTPNGRVNQQLCELLVYLGSTNVVQKTIPLLGTKAPQEEKLHYLFVLRLVKSGWTLPERRTYFEWLGRARREFQGANMMPTALNYIRADAEGTLTTFERAELSSTLAALDHLPPPATPISPNRRMVKEWTMNDFNEGLGAMDSRGDAALGQRLYAEAGCAQCHRLGREGGVVGPDLTEVSARFDRKALLENIIEPSKVIPEIYRTATITTRAGAIHDGLMVGEDAQSIVIAINPVDPDQRRRINKSEIASQRVSEVSMMPGGLLDTFTREEIFELLAWIEAGGAGNSKGKIKK